MTEKRVKAWAVVTSRGRVICVCLSKSEADDLVAPIWTGERVVPVEVVIKEGK